MDRRALRRSLAEVTLITDCQVDLILYTPVKFAQRLGPAESPSRRFLSDPLRGGKTLVAGAQEALRPIAAAADVRITGDSDG